MLAVEAVGRRLQRVDDQRAVQAGLFLEHGMAVVPVGPRLLEGEAVLVGLAGGDAVEAQAGHAIHVGRQQDAVPVDRGGVRLQRVGHAHADGIALAPAQDRRGQAAVDGDRRAGAAGEVGQRLADAQLHVMAAEHLRGTGQAGTGGREGTRTQAGGGQAGDHAASSHALHEQAA
ncbi:hypothetical protein D3C86_1000920 [compost metagenome]